MIDRYIHLSMGDAPEKPKYSTTNTLGLGRYGARQANTSDRHEWYWHRCGW